MTEVGSLLVYRDGRYRPTAPDDAEFPAGGGGIDYVQQADPGAVGADKTWLKLAPARNPPAWQLGLGYVLGQRVQPTTPNGHYYSALNAGTSDATEPAVWPTDGSTVMDNDIEWDDYGLLGVVLPLDLQLYVRKPDDSGWYAAGVSSRVNGNVDLETFDDSGITRSLLHLSPDSGASFQSFDAGGQNSEAVEMTSGAGISMSGTSLSVITADSAVQFNFRQFVAGTVDPSAGGGVAAPVGSQYSRDNSGVGELWFKTGGAATAWTKVV